MGVADVMARKKARRSGRERGCWIYVAAEDLERMGFDPYGEVPYYRIWSSVRGGLRARLYREP